MTAENRKHAPNRRGPEAIGAVVKRYRKRDRQYTYALRMRADGEKHWVPLGTEREGWNDVRAADRRDEIAGLIRRGAWRPPNTFELDPREKNPGFHEFASDWLKRYRRTVDDSTADTAEYMLSHHLLPFLHTYRLDEIDYAVLSAYVAHKLERNEEIAVAREAGVTLRDAAGRPRRPLSPRTINMTLDLIARIFKDAVKRGMMQGNPASDRDLRLKVTQRKGNFLEADELLALIEAAAGIDQPISKETLARAELARRMRQDNKTWKEIGAELEVAPSTATWLAAPPRQERAGERPSRHPRHAWLRRASQQRSVRPGPRRSRLCARRDPRPRRQDRSGHTPGQHDALAARRAARLPRQPAERAARGARVPDADRRTPRPAQHQPQRHLPADRQRRMPLRAERKQPQCPGQSPRTPSAGRSSP